MKKDRELTSLKFVSFKVEVNDEDFDHLMDPEIWPVDIRVREFLQKQTLGDYLLPQLSKTKNRTQSNDRMETSPAKSTNTSPNKQPEAIVL